tara:strand:- start:87 stop:590 length:504 start_codon:yes stop_codon:yes gene_type:complete
MIYWRKILILLTLLAAVYSAQAVAAKPLATNFTLRDINGQSYVLSEHRGEVIILNFWATWCGPCALELPHLNAIAKEYAENNVSVVVVSIDAARNASRVRSYIRARNYVFTALHDTDTTVVSQYHPSKTIPFTVIIDQKGAIVYQQVGYSPGDEQVYIDIIKNLLHI